MENENTNPESRLSTEALAKVETPSPELSFETALAQLTELVKKMESGTMPLDDSVKAYEMGMKLKAYLEQVLKEAELKIEQLKPGISG